MFSSRRFHGILANTALGRTQKISNLPLLSPSQKKSKRGGQPRGHPAFLPPFLPLSKRAKSRTCTGRKKAGERKEEKERRAEWGQFQFSKPRKRRGGRTTDRPGRERESGKLFAFPPPLFPATTSQQRKKKFQLAGGPSLQGWRECPGWMEDCCSVFGSKIGGGGGSGLFVWKEENFIPLFSHPLFSSLLDRFQRPSPLLLSSKAGRRVSGGRKEPRRRSSTPPSHFPPPRRPKNPYPFVFFPGRRAAPSLPNHPTTASSSSIPSSLSLRGCRFSIQMGGGRNKVFRAFRKEEEGAEGNGEQGGEGDRICAQSCPGHPSGGCEQTFLLSQSQPVFCLAFLSRSGEKERELKKQGRIDSVCERGRG